jgi:hypothetical protein
MAELGQLGFRPSSLIRGAQISSPFRENAPKALKPVDHFSSAIHLRVTFP